MRNPYDVLGVARTASEAEIKKAFRKLAKQHHPDSNKDPKSKDRFAEANTAYEILGDKEKRGQFDRGEIDAEGKPRFQGFQGGGAEGFEGFPFGAGGAGSASRRSAGGDEFFSQIFGEAMRSGMGGGRRARAVKGEDIAATLDVTLEEVAEQAKKRLGLPNGRDVEVTIPKGVREGQVIRLRGQGQGGPGLEPGDLLLTIHVLPHERFEADGANLRLRLPVELEDAVLGGKVRVPTLTGSVEMTIPPMTSSGRTLRLRGKGLPNKAGAGDLLVTTELRLPAEADEGLLDYARKRRSAKVE